jgi:hypothetical protein
VALPTSAIWDLADFSGPTLTSLLTLGPGEGTITPPTAAPNFTVTPDQQTVLVASEDGSAGRIDFDVAIPARYTVEFVARFPRLPNDVGDLASARVGLTIADDGGRGVSIYFAATGLAVSRVDDFGSVTSLPDTTDDVQEVREAYKTIRVAVDSSAGRAYVYIGDGDTVRPDFRFIVPVEETPPAASDTLSLFVQGQTDEPVLLELRRFQVAGDLLIPNFPPVADAGPDRVSPVGQAVRFDGRASFDLEGAPLQYRWSAIDAPFGSSFAADVGSGNTADDGDADGFTRTLSFGAGALPAWVSAGDVLQVAGTQSVVATVDNPGGTLTVTADTIPDSLSNTPFRIIDQSLLIGADTETPYSLPDVQGIYRYELVVNDGEIDSEPAEVLANMVGAQAPFGVEPNVAPIWRALGSEWQLIENRGVFEEAWRASAQILGAKLLEAWQYHYNFSIRDVQPTFQKKWVPFRTLVTETAPDTAEVLPRYGVSQGTHQFELSDPVVTGDTLDIEIFTGLTPTETATVSITLTGDTLDQIIADLNASLAGVNITAYGYTPSEDNGLYRFSGEAGFAVGSGQFTDTWNIGTATPPAWVTAGTTFVFDGLRLTVTGVSPTEITVDQPRIPTGASGDYRVYREVRLGLKSSLRGFRVLPSSTAAATLGFPLDTLSYLSGAAGARAASRTFYAGDGIDLVEQGVAADDLLILNNGQAFRIDRVVSGPLDPMPNQRLLLSEELPFDASASWSVPSVLRSSEVNYELELVYPGDLVKAEVSDILGEGADDIVDVQGVVVGVRGSTVAANLHGFYGYFQAASDYELRVLGVKRRKALALPDETLSVPRLQDAIPVGANPTLWQEQVDYILEPFYREADESEIPALQFRDSVFIDADLEPPDVLWAEFLILSNEPNVENLFGRLAGFLRDDAALFAKDFNYTAGVAGLLYAEQRGPRVRNIEIGAQILLGQPFAEADGVIIEIRDDYSPEQGRMIIQDDDGNTPSESEIFRTYFYTKDPNDLSATSGLDVNPATEAPWAVGDSISQFSPIGSGVDVLDLYNDPNWYYPFVRTGLLNEIQKFHTFVVRFQVETVSLANLALLFQFITRVKPTYTEAIILGLQQLEEDLDVADDVEIDLAMDLYEASCPPGPAFMHDDYRGDGTIWSSYDDGVTYYDQINDCPEEVIEFLLTIAWAGGIITHDSIFFYDTEVTDVDGTIGAPGSTFTPTHDQVLPAGTYTVLATIRAGGVVP